MGFLFSKAIAEFELQKLDQAQVTLKRTLIQFPSLVSGLAASLELSSDPILSHSFFSESSLSR